MSTNWAAFARTGNPDNPTIPHWPAYRAGERAVMHFDAACRVGRIADDDPRHAWVRIAEGA